MACTLCISIPIVTTFFPPLTMTLSAFIKYLKFYFYQVVSLPVLGSFPEQGLVGVSAFTFCPDLVEMHPGEDSHSVFHYFAKYPGP